MPIFQTETECELEPCEFELIDPCGAEYGRYEVYLVTETDDTMHGWYCVKYVPEPWREIDGFRMFFESRCMLDSWIGDRGMENQVP